MSSSFEAFLLEKAAALPRLTYSPVLQQVMTLLDSPECNFDDLAGLISQDEILCGRLLLSVEQESQRRIADIRHAIRLIGVSNLKNFVGATTQASDNDKVDAQTFEVMQGRVLMHSQLVASCAEKLAEELGYPNVTLAYTAGLLHDLGTAILNSFAYAEISQAIKLTEAKAVSTVTAEDRALGFNHSYFGGKVLAVWGMAEAIIDAARFHHTPRQAEDHSWLVKIIHLADVAVYCQQTKLPIGISLFPVDKSVLAELPFAKTKLIDIANAAAEEVAQLDATPL